MPNALRSLPFFYALNKFRFEAYVLNKRQFQSMNNRPDSNFELRTFRKWMDEVLSPECNSALRDVKITLGCLEMHRRHSDLGPNNFAARELVETMNSGGSKDTTWTISFSIHHGLDTRSEIDYVYFDDINVKEPDEGIERALKAQHERLLQWFRNRLHSSDHSRLQESSETSGEAATRFMSAIAERISQSRASV